MARNSQSSGHRRRCFSPASLKWPRARVRDRVQPGKGYCAMSSAHLTPPAGRLPPTTESLLDDTARSYFLWWTDATVCQFKEHLRASDPEESAYWMGAPLRFAILRLPRSTSVGRGSELLQKEVNPKEDMMKNLMSLIFVLGTVFVGNGFTPASRPAGPQGMLHAQVAPDICVPEIGPICVCRTCVYNDDGTCSCPAESREEWRGGQTSRFSGRHSM